MKKFICILFILCFSAATQANIGEDILNKYKKLYHQMTPIQQEHFTVRMFAITGDKQYLLPIFPYLMLLVNRYNHLLANVNSRNHIQAETNRLVTTDPLDSDKKIIRMLQLRKNHWIAYDFNFLILLYKIYFYKLEKTPFVKSMDPGKRYLQSRLVAMKQFILDERNIKIYGAQLINYVYYLLDLNLIDLRMVYTRQFKKAFPDEQDKNLSINDYSAKIYGLTHFIVAASNYYQKNLNAAEFAWIMDYFDKNIDNILKKTENDIITEIGICYLLLGKAQSPVFQKIKAYIRRAYDPSHHMLPNKVQSFDALKGEHRNILAIMLFNWPQKLSPVPDAFFQHFFSNGFVLNDNNEVNYGFNLIK